jgi:hypothetical protein
MPASRSRSPGAAVCCRRVRRRLAERLTEPQRRAIRDAWQAFWLSRVLVWAAGLFGLFKLGYEPLVQVPGITRASTHAATALAAPATGFDSAFYLTIAHHGYGDLATTAFFPLYPSLARLAGLPLASTLYGGIAASLAALGVALYLLHRLVALELGDALSRPAVLAVAFFPTALFLSAIHSEGLFLALSVGSFYSARRGWWARAGILGLLAAATRSTGVLLLLPLALMYLYGPRGDRPTAPARRSGRLAVLRSRHPLRPDALWLLAVPLGLAAYLGYLWVDYGDPLATFEANREIWGRRLLPLGGLWEGAFDAGRGVAQLALGRGHDIVPTGEVEDVGQLADPLALATVNLTNFAFLLFAVVATVGALRRLPLPYGAYAIATLVAIVSAPAPHEPLLSLPRFVAVLFPLQIWLALWMRERGRESLVLAASASLLTLFAAEFATWRWVA